MPTLYLDIFSGISGDMFLGALLDLGLPLDDLQRELRKLSVGGYHLHARRAAKSGIEGVKFDVHFDDPHSADPHHGHGHDHGHGQHTHDHGHGHGHDHSHAHGHPHSNDPHDAGHGRNYAEIRTLINESALDPWVREKAVAIFHRIAVAEGKIHGKPPEAVHFHEVGALDSIVDVTGACIGLNWLGRPTVRAGTVVEGTGFVRCAHGRMPLPAPATLEIFAARGVSLTQCPEPHELVTPTGAAILAEFAVSFGPLPGFAPRKVGYGLGTRENHTRPNLVRAILGDDTAEVAPAPHDWESDQVCVLETNLDDISGEVLGHVHERALAAGALDVFHTAIQMKKNRPGTLLTVLCALDRADTLAALLLTETSAFGVRRTLADRRKLKREFQTVVTEYGSVAVKIGTLDGRRVQIAPEFEACRLRADEAQVPIKAVYDAARAAAR